MDQQNIDFSDTEKFLLSHYRKCPVHKRSIMYLRLDNKKDSQVIKCQKCLDEKKFKNFIDIVELLQSDDHFIFQKWPIHDDDKISKNLKKINQWPFAQYCEEINLIFDEIVEKTQQKRKEILKDLGQIQENQQKSLNYYKQISQKEKLVDIIKNQFGDQKKQNEMILNIIKENEQNYESNKKQLVDLIYQSNKHLFDLTKVKNMKDKVLSLIDMLKIFDNQQDNQTTEQLNNMSINNNYQNLEEITINQFEELDKCYDFKKININFKEQNLKGEDLEELQNTFDQCKNITDLQLDLSETGIGDEAIKYVKKGLAKHQNITSLELQLSNNQIGVVGAKRLANSIKKIQNLIYLNLDLRENFICKEAVQNLAIAIQKSKNLISLELGLSQNDIETEGAQHIAKALSQLQNLNTLYLYLDYCKIQDEGAICISESIKILKNISRIYISLRQINLNLYQNQVLYNQQCSQFKRNNDIGIKGVQNIANSIEKFEKINFLGLNFQDNNIGIEGSKLIMNEIEKKNQKIKILELNLMKCPIHKRSIIYLRLDNKEDPQVIKCQKCLDEKKFKSFIDIVDLLSSDDHFLFQKWPIYDDDTISENLEKIKQWPFNQHCEDINCIFDEMVEKIQLKRKEILKDLGQIQEDQQKSLNYYKYISQQEKLTDIIKSQFGDQKKQNEMILSIIKENEQNYESNKKQLVDWINEANKNIFDLNKVKNMKDKVLSLISMLKIFDNQQDNSIIEQIDNTSVDENDQNFEEITINQFDDLDKCYDFKKIQIDLKKYNFEVQDLEEIQNTFLKCKNITELKLDLQETNIGDEAIKYIKNGLAKHQNITRLELLLENNQITELGAKYLANSIEYIQNLICLNIDLCQNLICNEAVQNIATAIQKNKNMTSLSLRFDENNIDAGGAQHIAKALSQLQNLNLLYLQLYQCQIKDEGAIYISESIKKLKYISQIFIGLRNSGISFRGVQNIANSIDNFEKINYLGFNFQENNIGNEGISYLAQRLQNFQNLETLQLCLGGNNIDDLGAQSVLQSIQNYKNIVDLEIILWESNLSIETARFIAKILQDFHKLSDLQLNLEDNNIGIQGCELIINEIEKKNQKIKKLGINLENNNIDAVNKEQIRTKLDMLIKQANNDWEYEI
ncbi:hypothetical protein ABPG74_013064 [Tetrahymena malaccensis]